MEKTMKEIQVQVWKTLLVSCFSRQVPGTILFPVRLANLAIQRWALVYASLPWKPIPPCLLCAYLYWLIFSWNTPANICNSYYWKQLQLCHSSFYEYLNFKLYYCCRSPPKNSGYFSVNFKIILFYRNSDWDNPNFNFIFCLPVKYTDSSIMILFDTHFS